MKVEIMNVRKVEGDGNLKAFAEVRLDGAVTIKGYIVMQGKKGLFASAPRKVGKDGNWFDLIIFDDKVLEKDIEALVLEAYNDAIE